ncbi:lipocalin-like domain-containing protein [uncultured Shewanella sp.]|uniref:lipocalin-like domain-containing protein n=1 Tax=uncultured Shewanella sp. TaxID=173975 RepID=UPI00260FB3F5|nr:lipocalin-like domain-containing protein [uncultured Shewanella sp.]
MLKGLLYPLLLSFLVFLLSACQPETQKPTSSAFQIESGIAVKKGARLVFPKDHGIHAEQGIEWWYVTANVESDTGETFGVQWTLFRTLMPSHLHSRWWDNNLYFAHFAMQHQQAHVAFERFGRAGQAEIIVSPFKAEINDWQLASMTAPFLPLTLTAAQEDYQVALTLSDSPMTLHGENGYSQKTQGGHASYYFSYPFLKVTGELTFAGKRYQVTGNAWYDREWSASLLDKSQLGWDWFSLVDKQADDKGLMLFCIRGKEQGYDYCSGTHIAANGEASEIDRKRIKLTVLETVTLGERQYPRKWQLKLPGSPAIIIESITQDSRNQLTFPYWEGRVKATGGFNGLGYAELTGY